MALGAVSPTGVNRFAPRYSGEHNNPAPNAGNAAFGGGRTNRSAVEGAKLFKKELGLPSYEDILGRIGDGFGTREYGNAGAAGEGAAYARGELDRWRSDLALQKGNVGRARKGVQNPTGTEGFKSVMRLTNERAGQAAEAERRQAAEAASRRGYVGGYSPGAVEKNRAESVATAGYEAAAAEREAQLALLGAEADLYGSTIGGYGSALGSYTDLTKTLAELPTKYLDSYSRLLSGLGGDYGSIFGTASQNVRFDTGNEREDADARTRGRQGLRIGMRSTPGAAGMI